jgi:acyl-coenzyme A thioesterase PaaI-like protein
MNQKQPGSKHCFICGRENPVGLKLDFYTIEPGLVRTKVTIPIEYEGYPGVVHGGILAAILDETGGRAHMTGPTFFMVTAQLNVRYRKPVPPETPLEVYGMAGERKGRVAKAHAEIRTLEGDVLTEADLVLVDIPDKKMAGVDLEEMGWKVYPDEED